MQCDICFRTGGHKLPFLCPTDARNQLYELRVQTAGIHLEKDAIDREISRRCPLPLSKAERSSNETSATITQLDHDALISERERIIDRTNQIIAHADELKANLERAKEERNKKKIANDRRKAELTSASKGIEARRTKQIEAVEGSTQRTKYRWNQTYDFVGESRAYLCYESANLYGLQRFKASNGGEEYRIAGVNIVDLRLMNTASPAQISTSLAHIAHVLMLATYYLAVRLPAEITLPHRDYPRPTIFSLSSSYMHTNVPFPGGTSSSSNSPSTSRHTENAYQPRPRPLWINKPLPILVNEDSVAHSSFLEGAILLAYNVAWLCKSQGVPGYVESEDKNTHKPERSSIGWASHGSAFSFLGSAEGAEFIRGFKLPRPNQMGDILKNKLMSEVANAEWELLSQDAWAIEDDMRSDGVVVGARDEGHATFGGSKERDYTAGMQSFMSMRTVMDAVEMVGEGTGINAAISERLPFGLANGTDKDRRERERYARARAAKDKDQDKKSGTSGWTKLKPRG
ncbi:hypothetical protein H4I96_01719 [Botrytis cinerea]